MGLRVSGSHSNRIEHIAWQSPEWDEGLMGSPSLPGHV